VFEASYCKTEQGIIPRIAGQAFITAESTLVIDDTDPLAWGIEP
jgi:proline racemase